MARMIEVRRSSGRESSLGVLVATIETNAARGCREALLEYYDRDERAIWPKKEYQPLPPNLARLIDAGNIEIEKCTIEEVAQGLELKLLARAP